MMLVMLFYSCLIVFLSTNISAGVINNDQDSNDAYGLVKGLAQMKDPVDFRLTKFFDIRLDVENKSTFDTVDMILSRMDKDSHDARIHENCSKILNQEDRLGADNVFNKYLLQKLESLTYQIQNVSEKLSEINKNISHLNENQISIHNDIRNGFFSISKHSNGVTYKGLYPRIESRKTKDNRTVNIPRDCKEVLERGNHTSGVYEIQPKLSPKPFLVLCDMDTRGGGWTHIQKRFDGSQDFFLGWRDYKFGFGDLDGEFWLGLENIYFLTTAGPELLIDMVDIDQKTEYYAHYKTFKIGPEPDGYPLSILTDFTGNAGDGLSIHKGQKFSTRDYDQDQSSTSNCAEMYFGAWWYKECYRSNLNGKYINLKVSGAFGKYTGTGPDWQDSSKRFVLSKTRMLVR